MIQSRNINKVTQKTPTYRDSIQV